MTTLAELLLVGRLCEADAQRKFVRLAHPTEGATLAGTIETGWYDQTLNTEAGWFALANQEGPLEPYVERVLRVVHDEHAIYVALLGTAGLTTPLALARRAYLALAPANVVPIACTVEVR